MMTRKEAEIKLKQWFGFPAFKDKQWEVVETLLQQKRMLFIAPTGFGKSLCYQFVAKVRAEVGFTIVFSPLISLMRDQIDKLNETSLKADTINSQRLVEEKEQVLNRIKSGEIDILYLAPEQIGGDALNKLILASSRKLAFVVIDEAHCISVWGHDFRPKYKKIVSIISKMPDHFPILACTATATPDVREDIKEQFNNSIPALVTMPLVRENISLGIELAKDQQEKFIKIMLLIKGWRNKHKNGIVYAGTRSNAEYLSFYLKHCGIKAVNYHAGLGELRREVEEDWKANKYQVIVATNALGMGVDKADIDFVIHLQPPQSLIHYYQEYGRAGRGGQPAIGLMFVDLVNDWKLLQHYVNVSKPDIEVYVRVMDVLKEAPASNVTLIKKLNLKKTTVDLVLDDLVLQGIVAKQGSEFELNSYEAVKRFDYQSISQIRTNKQAQLDVVKQYTQLEGEYAKFIADYLGDETNYTQYPNSISYAEAFKNFDFEPYTKQYQEFEDNFYPDLGINKDKMTLPAKAVGYYGVSKWGEMIKASKYGQGGDFPQWAINRLSKLYQKHYKQAAFDAVVFVPPTKSGPLVENMAINFCKSNQLTLLHAVKKVKATKEQKDMNSGHTKTTNVKGAFEVDKNSVIDKNILILDDVSDSGATLKEVGATLLKAGAKSWSAIVLGKTAVADE